MSDLNSYEESLAIDLAKAEARIDQLERELVVAIEVVDESGMKRGEAEAKLAKAVEALRELERERDELFAESAKNSAKLAKAVAMFKAIEMWDAARGYPMPYRVRDPIRAVLAELEGKDV